MNVALWTLPVYFLAIITGLCSIFMLLYFVYECVTGKIEQARWSVMNFFIYLVSCSICLWIASHG